MAKEYKIGYDTRRRDRARRSLPKGSRCWTQCRRKFGFRLTYTNYDLGGERYLRTGETLPDSVLVRAEDTGCALSLGP